MEHVELLKARTDMEKAGRLLLLPGFEPESSIYATNLAGVITMAFRALLHLMDRLIGVTIDLQSARGDHANAQMSLSLIPEDRATSVREMRDVLDSFSEQHFHGHDDAMGRGRANDESKEEPAFSGDAEELPSGEQLRELLSQVSDRNWPPGSFFEGLSDDQKTKAVQWARATGEDCPECLVGPFLEDFDLETAEGVTSLLGMFDFNLGEPDFSDETWRELRQWGEAMSRSRRGESVDVPDLPDVLRAEVSLFGEIQSAAAGYGGEGVAIGLLVHGVSIVGDAMMVVESLVMSGDLHPLPEHRVRAPSDSISNPAETLSFYEDISRNLAKVELDVDGTVSIQRADDWTAEASHGEQEKALSEELGQTEPEGPNGEEIAETGPQGEEQSTEADDGNEPAGDENAEAETEGGGEDSNVLVF